MTESKTKAEQKPRRWVRVVLFVSLALNLAVAGMVIGAVLRHGPPGKDHYDARLDRVSGPYVRALSNADKRAMGQAIRAELPNAPDRRAARRAQVEAMLAALQAQPFDADRVDALLRAQFAAGAARQDIGRALLVERIKTMSDQERSDFAARLKEEFERPSRRKRHKDD